MLYHASPLGGLKMLLPHRSTHGKDYVYALRDPLTPLFFGAKKDDFDLLIAQEDGRPVLRECYPNAFQAVYSGQACSLYAVDEAGFLANQTGWDAELVCQQPVPVLQEVQIPDLYAFLQAELEKGGWTLHTYSSEASYQQMLREELLERVPIFGLTQAQMRADPRFPRYFPWLIDA